MSYAHLIRKLAPATVGKYDPRHIEAIIRTGHGTLDSLSRAAFIAEIALACRCIDVAGVEHGERSAKSWGL
jgi:hypothetical protein